MHSWENNTGSTIMAADDIFTYMVNDTRDALKGVSTVAFSGCIFALGEKLANFRNALQQPDIQTLAELKTVYEILVQEYEHSFFAEYAKMNLSNLYEITVDWQALADGKRDVNKTPPDVRLMIDIYNAIWQIHYQHFLANPAEALATWNCHDKYQNRAIRAVLFDLPYHKLVHLARVVVAACHEEQLTDKPAKLLRTMHKKRETVLTILCSRDETPDSFIDSIEQQHTIAEQEKALKKLASSIRGKVQQDNTLFATVKGVKNSSFFTGAKIIH